MPSGYGHYKVTITYYGKTYSAIVSDMYSIDAYRADKGEYRITPKQASIMLYNDVKRDNNLGKYNY